MANIIDKVDRIENKNIYLDNSLLLKLFLEKEVISKNDFYNFLKNDALVQDELPNTIDWSSSDSVISYFTQDDTDDLDEAEFILLKNTCLNYLNNDPSIKILANGAISFFDQSLIGKAIDKLSITSADIGQGNSLVKGFKLSPSYLGKKFGYDKKFYDNVDLAVLRRLELVKSFLKHSRSKNEEQIIISEKNPFEKRAKLDFGDNTEGNKIFVRELGDGVIVSAKLDLYDPKTGSVAYFQPCQKSNSSIISELTENATKIAHDNFVINGNENFKSKLYVLNKLSPALLNEVQKNPDIIPSVTYEFDGNDIKITPDENFMTFFEVSNIEFPLKQPYTYDAWKSNVWESNEFVVNEKYNLRDNYFHQINQEEKIYNESLNVINTLDKENLSFEDFMGLMIDDKSKDLEELLISQEKVMAKLVKELGSLKTDKAKLSKQEAINSQEESINETKLAIKDIDNDINLKIKNLLETNPNSVKAINSWKKEFQEILGVDDVPNLNRILISKLIQANVYLENVKNNLFIQIQALDYNMKHHPEWYKDKRDEGQKKTLITHLLSKTGKTFEEVLNEKVDKIEKLEMKSIPNLTAKIKKATIFTLDNFPEKINPLNKLDIMFDLETGGKSSKSSGISQFTAIVFERDNKNKVVNSFYIDQYMNPEMNMKPVIKYDNDIPVFGNMPEAKIVAYTASGMGLDEDTYKKSMAANPDLAVYDFDRNRILNMYSQQEPEAVDVHKISNDKVSKEKGFYAYSQKIQGLFADSNLYAHNGIKFDVPFIKEQLNKYPPNNNGLLEHTKIFDTRDIARDLIPPFILQNFLNEQVKKQVLMSNFSEEIDNTKLYTLDNLARFFKIDLSERITSGHDAKIDTKIMATLWNNLVKIGDDVIKNKDFILASETNHKQVKRKEADLEIGK